jgi:hypothetical protein
VQTVGALVGGIFLIAGGATFFAAGVFLVLLRADASRWVWATLEFVAGALMGAAGVVEFRRGLSRTPSGES